MYFIKSFANMYGDGLHCIEWYRLTLCLKSVVEDILSYVRLYWSMT